MSNLPNPRGLKGRLLKNSIEAYVLALETINRLSITYRVEAFCYLICNAWELLLKARLIQISGSPNAAYFKKERGKLRRSLPLRACLKGIFTNEKDPVRRNIEIVADVRDEATHLVISKVPQDVMALFQACVLNYHEYLQNWWEISLSDRLPVGMMALTYDLSPTDFDFDSSALKKQIGKDTAAYLMNLQADLRKEFDSLGRVAEFSIDVDYKLALVRKVSDADIALTTGDGGKPTSVLPIPKDTSDTHPFREMNVLEKLNEELTCERDINGYDVRCVVKAHNVKENGAYFYQTRLTGFSPQYSQGFIDWVVRKYGNDANFFDDARAWVRQNS